MKRLIVRLSVVGAILALGAIAIAQSYRAHNSETPEDTTKTAPTQQTDAGDDRRPNPILAEEDFQLEPPPAHLFQGRATTGTDLSVVRGNDGEDDDPPVDPTLPPVIPATSPGDAYGGVAEMSRAASPAQYEQSPEPGDNDVAQAQSQVPMSSLAEQARRAAASTSQNPPQTRATVPPNTMRQRELPSRSSAPSTSGQPTTLPATQVSPGNPAADGYTGSSLAPIPTTSAAAPEDPTADTIGSGGYGTATAAPYGGATYGGTYGNDNYGGTYGNGGYRPDPYGTDAAELDAQEPASQYPGQLGAGAISTAQPLPEAEVNRGAAAGTGVPGPTNLEGPQTPTLTLEKTAPQEIQVDKPATFEIKVRNTGRVAAHHVTVVDEIPQGTELIDATPPFSRNGSTLTWDLGTVEPGQQSSISIQLRPLTEGQIGSVARLSFETKASASTMCTKPELSITHSAEQTVLIGNEIAISITLTNTGSGPATGLVLEDDVPENFMHPAGNELEFDVGTLKPQESRKVELVLKAERPGLTENMLVVRGDGNIHLEDRIPITVIAPELQVSVKGPQKRYLDRQATYDISLANPGTAPAHNVQLVTYLPKALRFISTDNHGQYDQSTHAVYWSLEQLPPGSNPAVSLSVLPVEPGEHPLRVEGQADLALAHSTEHKVLVDGLAELLFSVADLSDPIEVGSETNYEIRITNKGSKADTDIRVVAELPAGLQPVGSEGPTAEVIQGQAVAFQPLTKLSPGSEVVYRIRARGVAAGDQRIQVRVTSGEMPDPLTKEESTRVYTDH